MTQTQFLTTTLIHARLDKNVLQLYIIITYYNTLVTVLILKYFYSVYNLVEQDE
jgi:hypothetical protein